MNNFLYALGLIIPDAAMYFLATVPFWGSERIRLNRLIPLFVTVLTIRALAAFILIGYVPNGAVLDGYFYLAYMPVILAAYFICYKIHPVKLLYTMLILIFISTAGNYLTSVIITVINPEAKVIFGTPASVITITLLMALIVPFAFRFFSGILRNAFSLLTNKSIFTLSIMPAMFFILINVYAVVFRGVTELPRPTITLLNICIMLTGLVSCYINIRMVLDTAMYIQTGRRLSEEKTLLENLSNKKSEFFGNISHEMKTPLTIIATDIQLAEKLIDEGDFNEAKELMREAWQETMQTANLVADALTLSRGQEVLKPMEYFNFRTIIEATLAVFEPFAKRHGNTFVCDIAKHTQIYGNADMLSGALVNLLTNANQHTNGGVITVKWLSDDEQYRLTVRDNGSGIPSEILARVFERGVSGGNSTGLGLAIVKNVTELHGGIVSIESEVGKGTAVTLAFPR